ncbi:hypothetical protein L6452_20191 [Arctium lappa]|uniref:Uncharacterized protein n=4 Tax=Arctium lappa TaxID=4217 RepID=A0ACB9BC10_ARCLA|nr:hypothetical protein L6452_20185 [Arctium lappa]KAI3719291.1 hypothetical protein L6452_20186 [Arctium lappa]KAI3719295.1 hypothetical protein L6452_20190 [Arctium lappa]KAI3719296.1 hypothetical protein L6452_20191 [Arctium lappa]
MMKSFRFLVVLVLLAATSFEIDAQTCKPDGGIRGKKPPPGQCNRQNDSDCCVQGKKCYTTTIVVAKILNFVARAIMTTVVGKRVLGDEFLRCILLSGKIFVGRLRT